MCRGELLSVKSRTFVVTSIASRYLERLGVTAPSAPTTVGTTFALTFQSRATSHRRSWYFSTFSFSFSTLPASTGTAISIMLQVFLSLSTTTTSGLLAWM